MSKTLYLKPRLSEKTYAQSESRVYAMDVPKNANKHVIAKAVEDQFEVKVKSVRVSNMNGKSKRVRSISGTRYSNAFGKRPDVKKAYVTLHDGHSLPFFAAIEEEEKQEQKTQTNIDKAIDKQAAKEAKPKRGLRLRKKEEAEGDK
jgi:large subunit ribosomal protein L23